MLIAKALGVQSREVIVFVGAGGKSTAMFRLANELVGQGKRVVTTTTTRLFAAQAQSATVGSAVLLHYDGTADFITRVRKALALRLYVVVVGEEVEENKAKENT